MSEVGNHLRYLVGSYPESWGGHAGEACLTPELQSSLQFGTCWLVAAGRQPDSNTHRSAEPGGTDLGQTPQALDAAKGAVAGAEAGSSVIITGTCTIRCGLQQAWKGQLLEVATLVHGASARPSSVLLGCMTLQSKEGAA